MTTPRIRHAAVLGVAAALTLAVLPPVAAAPPIAAATPATATPAAADTPVASAPPVAAPAADMTPARRSSRIKQQVTVTTSAGALLLGERVAMTARLHPETHRRVTFRYRRIALGATDWTGVPWHRARTRATNGHGFVGLTWRPPRTGIYRLRAQSPRAGRFDRLLSPSMRLAVRTTPPTPSAAPTRRTRLSPPTPQLSATFPATGHIDVPITVPVTIAPASQVTVTAQEWDAATGTWQQVPGGGARTQPGTGAATLSLQTGIAGPATFRVLAGNGVASTSATVTFDADYLDAFYTPPPDAPATPGVMLRTMPMTGTQPSGSIPTAPLPTGTTQYRFLYTTMRYSPVDYTSSPDVSSGMVYLPPPNAPVPKGYSATNRPVVVWAHPTLGLAQACAPSAGGEGYTTNYLDMSWFLSAGGESLSINTSGGGSVTVLPKPGGLLANGYVVVLPDYLSVATPGKETYVIGQQEANDVLYAVKAVQAPASTTLGWNAGPVPNSTWPGTGAGGDVVVAGHSQGGHAALWTGVANPLATSLGINLLGVVAVAPAADILQTFAYNWNTQDGWALGPYIAKTFVDYFGTSFLASLTPQGQQQYEALSQMCLSELEAYVDQTYPSLNGQPGGPVATTFSLQPDHTNPTFAATWGAQLNQITPILATQQVAPPVPLPQRPGYPKGIPTFLVQGQNDSTIIAQTTAALQETMCRAGYPLDAYYPAPNPDAGESFNGISLPGMADHSTILNWPIPDSVFSLLPSAPAGIEQETPASRVAEWIAARFLDLPQAVDCADPWTFTAPGWTTSVGTIPASTTGIHAIVPQDACATTNPNSDDTFVPMQCWPPNSDGNYPGLANPYFSTLWIVPALLGAGGPWGNQAVPLAPNTQYAGTPAYPAVDATSLGFGKLDFPGAGLYTIGDRAGLFPFAATESAASGAWTYQTNTAMINRTGPSGEALPDGHLYAKAGDPTPGATTFAWGYYPADGVYYRTPGMPPVVNATDIVSAMRSGLRLGAGSHD